MESIDLGLRGSENGEAAWFVKETPDHEILVLRHLFTFSVCTFPRGHAFPNWYEDRWCYSTIAKAQAAAEAWDGVKGTDPPGDWIRHVPSMRPGPGARRG